MSEFQGLEDSLYSDCRTMKLNSQFTNTCATGALYSTRISIAFIVMVTSKKGRNIIFYGFINVSCKKSNYSTIASRNYVEMVLHVAKSTLVAHNPQREIFPIRFPKVLKSKKKCINDLTHQNDT